MAAKRAKQPRKKVRPPAVPSRARLRATAAEVNSRVTLIEREMTTCGGIWPRARPYELAAEWGVKVDVVWKYSAEASRRVRSRETRTPEEHRADLRPHLEVARCIAAAAGDAKGIVASVLAEAKIYGLDAPQKVAVTDSKGEDLPLEIAQHLLSDEVARLAFVATGRLPPRGS